MKKIIDGKRYDTETRKRLQSGVTITLPAIFVGVRKLSTGREKALFYFTVRVAPCRVGRNLVAITAGQEGRGLRF